MTDTAASHAGPVHTGRCHCGAVSYRATGMRDIWYCHCEQCRRLTGHHMAACRTERERITVTGEVAWTMVSPQASHGFCARCHSPLFWQSAEAATLSVLAGSLDDSTGIAAVGHIFVAEKPAYYAITDGLPQYATWPETGPLSPPA